MRAISLVDRIEFDFPGNVVRNALTLGDLDNDGCNELIVGNAKGEVSIFKGRSKIQSIHNLSFVSCIAVGDVLNRNKNVLIIITANGWCYIYSKIEECSDDTDEGIEEVDGQIQSTSGYESERKAEKVKSEPKQEKESKGKDKSQDLVCVHKQRIPANAKNILVGDIDGDGLNEMVLGLTDRVVRSYRWIEDSPKSNSPDFSHLQGQFLALNKWECANQIGSITLHHSLDGKASLLVAQPGGTFMRIRCPCEDSHYSGTIVNSEQSESSSLQGENISCSVDYQFLGISRMRNQNISTEIVGDLKSNKSDSSSLKKGETNMISKAKPYAVATLDGTIMLVQDEVILWAIAVDHQIFALSKLDVTGDGSDDIVVCSWDGQTYILDQDKNSVRFHLDEPVQAFESGFYNVKADEPSVSCLVYVTFKNSILIYYDIPLKDLTCKHFEPDLEKISDLFILDEHNEKNAMERAKRLDKRTKNQLVEYLLYNVKL